MFCRIFGADSKPTSLSRREWDRFIADRRAERVAPKGAELGKSVGARIIAYDLITLRAVLNWATMVSDGEGGFLLDRNPLKDLPLPRNESPARRVLTAEQYLALRTAAATFDNPRVGVFLFLAHETGHRAASIRQLRSSDIDLERRVVCWRAECDKIGFEHTTPLTDAAVAVLRAEQARVATIGDAWVFPGGARRRFDHEGRRDALLEAARGTSGPAGRRSLRLALLPAEVRHGAEAEEPEGPLRPGRLEGGEHAAEVLHRT
jgi:integrase